MDAAPRRLGARGGSLTTHATAPVSSELDPSDRVSRSLTSLGRAMYAGDLQVWCCSLPCCSLVAARTPTAVHVHAPTTHRAGCDRVGRYVLLKRGWLVAVDSAYLQVICQVCCSLPCCSLVAARTPTAVHVHAPTTHRARRDRVGRYVLPKRGWLVAVDSAYLQVIQRGHGPASHLCNLWACQQARTQTASIGRRVSWDWHRCDTRVVVDVEQPQSVRSAHGRDRRLHSEAHLLPSRQRCSDRTRRVS
jgi:hypothetical protein